VILAHALPQLESGFIFLFETRGLKILSGKGFDGPDTRDGFLADRSHLCLLILDLLLDFLDNLSINVRDKKYWQDARKGH
jgi:hypothetical protein